MTGYLEKHGASMEFYDAVCELREAGIYHTAPELPGVSFQEWDCVDMGEFHRLMDQTPIDLDSFAQNIWYGSAPRTERQDAQVDQIPMKHIEGKLVGLHQHQQFELTYVLNGQAKVSLNGETCTLSAGTLCLIAPGFPHDTAAEHGSLVISISLSERTVENTLFRLLKSENVVTDFFRASLGRDSGGYMLFHLPAEKDACRRIRDIFHYGYSREPYAQFMFIDSVEIFFCYLLQRCSVEYERYTEERKAGGSPGLLPILRYIQENYRTTSLQETAARFHYESNYLSKLIKAHMGKTYTQIVGELRFAEAGRLLSATGLSVEQVAEQVGFHSTVHLSRSFRQHTGMSPTQYRKTHRAAGADPRDTERF